MAIVIAKVYRLVPQGAFLAVMEDGGEVVSQGVDLRSEKEALSFLGSIGHERGLIMNPVRDEHGRLSHVEASPDPAAMRFSVRSMQELDQLKSHFSATVRRHAAELAAADGRFMVDDGDIRAALAAAVAELAREGS